MSFMTFHYPDVCVSPNVTMVAGDEPASLAPRTYDVRIVGPAHVRMSIEEAQQWAECIATQMRGNAVCGELTPEQVAYLARILPTLDQPCSASIRMTPRRALTVGMAMQQTARNAHARSSSTELTPVDVETSIDDRCERTAEIEEHV